MTAITRWIYPFIISLLATILLSACAPGVSTSWLAVYSNDKINHNVKDVQRAPQGGYIAAGNHWTMDTGGSKSLPPWLLKAEENSEIKWQFTIGKSSLWIEAVTPTRDGGNIITGSITENNMTNLSDLVAIKLDTEGAIQWQNRYSGLLNDNGNAVIETRDGGFLIAGDTQSFGASTSGIGTTDAWILKLNNKGSIIWQKRYGSMTLSYPNPDRTTLALETSDNNYLIGGTQVSENGVGLWSWIMKLDTDGNILLQRKYNGFDPNTSYFGATFLHAAREIKGKGYILATTIAHPYSYVDDASAIKVDVSGNIEWKASYLNSKEYFSSGDIRVTEDGTYLMVGSTSPDVLTGSSHFRYHTWLTQLNQNGNIAWQKAYDPYRGEGRTYGDFLSEIFQYAGMKRIAISGFTRAPGTTLQNLYLMNLSPDGTLPEQCGQLSPPHAQRNEPLVTVVATDAGFTAHKTDANVIAMKLELQKSVLIRHTCTALAGRTGELPKVTTSNLSLASADNMLPFEYPTTLNPCTRVRLGSERVSGFDRATSCTLSCPHCSLSVNQGFAQYPQEFIHLYHAAAQLERTPGTTFAVESLKPLQSAVHALASSKYFDHTLQQGIAHMLSLPTQTPIQKSTLLQTLNRTLNAVELDQKTPAVHPQAVTQGDLSTIDLSGVALIDVHKIHAPGSIDLAIKPGLPASVQGLISGWPIITYSMNFDGKLANDGFFDINLYIGGLSFGGDPGQIRLLEWDGTSYHDITTAIDLRKATIKGRTNRLREYVVVAATQ